jgi:uncharacterized protein (DUF1330 family)
MKQRHSTHHLAALAAAAVLVIGTASIGRGVESNETTGAAHGGPVQFVDLLWLRQGVTVDDAQRYLQTLAPLVKKHGGRPLVGFRIDKTMKGDVQPQVINGLEFPSMQAMQALLADPEYQKIVPTRDATFDMARHTLFQVSPLR